MQVHGLPPGLSAVANGSLSHDGGGLKSPRMSAAAAGDAATAKQQPDEGKPEQQVSSHQQLESLDRHIIACQTT
jgi:hypothetical protein